MKHFKHIILSAIIMPLLLGAATGTVYKDKKLSHLRIPVGGLATGNILMGGRGNIEHVEIFNRPDRQRVLEKTHFALWMRQGDNEPVTKLLEREFFPPYTESTHKYVYGLPRMQHAELTDQFPLYTWTMSDPQVPLKTSLQTFSPFIPLDVDNSSYPAIAFYWTFENTSSEPIKASIVFNMENPIKGEHISNAFIDSLGVKGIHFKAEETRDVNHDGGVLISTPMQQVDVQTHWFPGDWRDEAHIFWDDFSDDGSIETKMEKWRTRYFNTSYNLTTKRMASVLAPFELQPGEKIQIPYYLCWHFPKRQFSVEETFGVVEAADTIFKNYYSRLFDSEWDVLTRFLQNEQELYALTSNFSVSLFSSSYPDYVKEALTTQATSLRSPLIQITAAGDVHGFEGVGDAGWCCPGTCTHVWNYEQTLASLFPSIERKMREIEFLHNTFDNGFMAFRSILPLGDYWFDGPAAADGQMGAVVRAYREWKFSGDDKWLARIWPHLEDALEFAWRGPGVVQEERFKHQQQQAPWDAEKSGIMSGKQHNTYDINFYGPSSMTTSIYLAALKAAAEMALAMGDANTSNEYLDIYKRGAATARDSLWNGDYFVQILENENSQKYQYGDGCLADQLLGQYLAFNSGLGFVIDSAKTTTAIQAIFANNYIEPLRSFDNVQRVYGLNDEAGVVLCTWPNNNRPALPFVYADEIWTGVEYQVAASLVYAGFVEQGLTVVQAVQDRYDGYKRNPYEHVESGVHYARAMASWSLLLALSGIEYDGRDHSLWFDPKIDADPFTTFWSTGSAWGTLTIDAKNVTLTVEHGELQLAKFGIKNKLHKIFPQNKTLSKNDKLLLKLEHIQH